MDFFIPTDDGRWVSQEYERLARAIQEYDPWLELRWIPPEHRTTQDKKPYMVIDTRINKPIFFASELDTPLDILERLLESDNTKNDVLDSITRRNLACDILKKKEWEDKLEDARDRAGFLINSPLNYIKYNGKKLDDQRREVK